MEYIAYHMRKNALGIAAAVDRLYYGLVLSPACEIADTRYYRAWVGVGKRETLCTFHKLFHNYLVIWCVCLCVYVYTV